MIRIRRRAALIPGLVLSLAAVHEARAQDPLYGLASGVSTNGQVFSINTTTGKATLLGGFNAPMSAAARNPLTRLIYGNNNNDSLNNPNHVWDPVTGTETGTIPGNGFQYTRMECSADGWIWGIKINSSQLYRINPATGASTAFGGLPTDTAGSAGDMAFAPGATNEFYYLAGSKFYKVRIPSMSATVLGFVSFQTTGLGFTEDGRLWASSNTHLYELDPANGDETQVGPFNSSSIIDLMSSLPPMYLNITPNVVNPGDPITLLTEKGKPGATVLTFITEVNGTPLIDMIYLNKFNGSGQSTLNGTTPNFSGLNVKLLSLGVAYDGRVILTNEESVSIN